MSERCSICLSTLERFAKKHDTEVHGLLQLNVSGEESKFGLDPEKINEFIDNDSIQDTVKNLKNITGKIDRGMNEKQIAEVSAALRQAIQNFSMITEKLQKEDNINKTATAIKGAGDAVIQSSESLESTLFKLNATLDKLTLLLNLLNENPSALLRGKEAKTSEIR